MDDLQKYSGDTKYRFDAALEDPNAEELWAKEIRIVQIFLIDDLFRAGSK